MMEKSQRDLIAVVHSVGSCIKIISGPSLSPAQDDISGTIFGEDGS